MRPEALSAELTRSRTCPDLGRPQIFFTKKDRRVRGCEKRPMLQVDIVVYAAGLRDASFVRPRPAQNTIRQQGRFLQSDIGIP